MSDRRQLSRRERVGATAAALHGPALFVEMTRAAADLLREALGLSEAERLDLAAELLASVEGARDADWDAAWAAELDRRDAQPGESGSNWAEVQARILSHVAKP